MNKRKIIKFPDSPRKIERSDVRTPSYYRRITPPADPLPPVVVQYQSVSQMRPKGMNKGNEGAEFGPTLQSVKGDIHELIGPLLNGGELKFLSGKCVEASK